MVICKTRFTCNSQRVMLHQRLKNQFVIFAKTFTNFVKLFINGISSFIFFLTKYNLVISDANPCVYHNNECIELSLGFLSMMKLHVPLMNPSSWTCAIYVDILRLINDLAMTMWAFKFNFGNRQEQFFFTNHCIEVIFNCFGMANRSKYAKKSHLIQGQSPFLYKSLMQLPQTKNIFSKLNENILHNVFIIHLMKILLIAKCCLMLIFCTTLIWHIVF